MAVTNAARWSEICEIQKSLLANLAGKFPQRDEQLKDLMSNWDSFKCQLESDCFARASSDTEIK
ncbi:hypothetical protein G3R49_04475 [Shewanella sp. WXL01]|uniref:hypothetical protein n=1 Tax=Shewanella sp. WXL01 TaxID=2709721 RepID=UPI0014385910|nr:hypothetical protein [Shewanella sp. WXL01]NKF49826.1 hypothetical protein [Shewanella sp. WXL01]